MAVGSYAVGALEVVVVMFVYVELLMDPLMHHAVVVVVINEAAMHWQCCGGVVEAGSL